MKLTFYGGSLPHFVTHLAGIYKVLPDDIRGRFHARGRGELRARELGIDAHPSVPRRDVDIIVVASYEDLRATRPAPAVLVNHGIGQTYIGAEDHPSYSGGRDRERVVLNLCPSERDAEVNRRAYPGARAAVIGPPCYLDPWLNGTKSQPVGDVVAISFHADVHVVPETRWALPYYRQAIIDLVHSGEFNIIGHSHPRMHSYMLKFWSSLKVPYEASFTKVLESASLFVNDNSSSLYEFAATDRPVIVLNAPWYRRGIHHGLRFWDAVPGYQVDHPVYLDVGIARGLCNRPEDEMARRTVLERVYGLDLLDGNSTQRSVEALVQLCESYGHGEARSQATSTR